MVANGEHPRFPTLGGTLLRLVERSRRRRLFGILALGLALSYGFPRVCSAGWLPSERLHPDTPFDEPVSDISVGPSAEPVSVWEAQGDIWWTQWSRGCKCWTTPAPLHLDVRIDEFPRISVGGDGVPWVLWSRLISFEAGFALLSSRFLNGAWTTPDTVIAQSSPSDIYDLHAVDSTNCWVASHKVSQAHGNQQVIFVFHHEDGRWAERGMLSAMTSPGHYDLQPSVTVDGRGRTWVGWSHQSPGPDFTPYVARLEGGKWSQPEAMPLKGHPPELAPIEDGVGVVWTAYTDMEDNRLDIAFMSWNGQWSPMEIISQPDGYFDDDHIPDIASADMGLVVIWVAGPRSQPTHMDVVAVHREAAAWTRETVISIPDSVELAQDKYPRVTLGPDGTAWACWSRLGPWPISTDEDLWFARGKLYGLTAAVDAGTSGAIPIRVDARPNPAFREVSVDYVIPTRGTYEAIVANVIGRVVERVSLGELERGRFSGAQAFRWSVAGRHPGGVYTITIRERGSRTAVVTSRVVMMP